MTVLRRSLIAVCISLASIVAVGTNPAESAVVTPATRMPRANNMATAATVNGCELFIHRGHRLAASRCNAQPVWWWHRTNVRCYNYVGRYYWTFRSNWTPAGQWTAQVGCPWSGWSLVSAWYEGF